MQSSLDGESKTVFDKKLLPHNVFSRGGTISPDGSLFAYKLSVGGSDWTDIRVRNVETGKDYPDVLSHLKFSDISWTNDNKGFFYTVSINPLIVNQIKYRHFVYFLAL